MLEFVHITDIHLANKPPEMRKDNYNSAIFKKLRYVFQYCNKKNIQYITLTGDLAHKHAISDELATEFVRLVTEYELKILFIYGNHDIQGGNTNFVHKTNFGLLEQYGWFITIADNPIVIDGVLFAGYDFNKEECIQSVWLLPKFDGKLPKYKHTVLLTHPMIVNEETMLIDGQVRQVNVNEVETNADLMLCGHYHDGFEKTVRGTALNRDYALVNPGSLARVAIDWNARLKKTGPKFAHIKMGKKIQVTYHQVPCGDHEDVFDITKHEKKKEADKEKTNFIDAMQGLSQAQVMGENFSVQLKNVLEHPPKELKKLVNTNVIKICKEKAEKYL